jgi:hypothetical protein
MSCWMLNAAPLPRARRTPARDAMTSRALRLSSAPVDRFWSLSHERSTLANSTQSKAASAWVTWACAIAGASDANWNSRLLDTAERMARSSDTITVRGCPPSRSSPSGATRGSDGS